MSQPNYIAVPPFTVRNGLVFDANGGRVIVCDEDEVPCEFYAEAAVDAEPWFCCDKCGRLGQRMVEATPKHANAAPETGFPDLGASKSTVDSGNGGAE